MIETTDLVGVRAELVLARLFGNDLQTVSHRIHQFNPDDPIVPGDHCSIQRSRRRGASSPLVLDDLSEDGRPRNVNRPSGVAIDDLRPRRLQR